MAMLWVDKYRPKGLDDCDYHKDLSSMLKQLVQTYCSSPSYTVLGPIRRLSSSLVLWAEWRG